MNQVWIIAANDLRVFLKEKAGYVWLFIMPLVFIYFFGVAMQRNDRAPSSPQPSLMVHNQDEGYMGELLVELLKAEGFETTPVTEPQPAERSLSIPSNFTEHVTEAEAVELDFQPGQSSGQEPAAMLEVRITRAVVAMTSAIFSLVSDESAAGLSESKLRQALRRERMVDLDVEFAGRKQVPSGFSQSVPGYVVMFVLMNLLMFGGLSISSERTNGVLQRLATYPVAAWQVVSGKILGRFLLGVVQISYLLVISRLLFGVDYGNLSLVILVLGTFAWGCAALGVFVGSVIRTPENIQGICTLVAVAMAALGGCWWPLEVVPETARRVGQLFPTAWSMNALHQLISFGGGWQQIQWEWLMLTSFALVTTILASRYLRVA